MYALTVSDVDADGVEEIITGGSSSTGDLELRIFAVSEAGVTEEHTEDWRVDGRSGTVFGLATADVDADGDPEIVTASTLPAPEEVMDLRVWRWNGSALNLEAEAQWDAGDDTDAVDVAVGNVDEDELPEIAVAGTFTNAHLDHSKFGVVSLWQWDGETIELEDFDVWQSSLGNVEYFGVSVANIDGAGADEIIVTGPLHETPPQNVLRVYGWDGWHLRAEYSEEWIAEGMDGNFAYVVHAANVDEDIHLEMITGGRAISAGLQNHHQITIWQLDWRRLHTERIPDPSDFGPELLNLVDCHFGPMFLGKFCDPRVNPDFDRFLIVDVEMRHADVFSKAELGLNLDDGPLLAAAPVTWDGKEVFVASLPNASSKMRDSGAVLFFNKGGQTIARIEGQSPGERLGMDMDVRGHEVVVASSRRLLRISKGKVIQEKPIATKLRPEKAVRAAFTDDVDGDKRPELLLGTPYANAGGLEEAGQIQVIGSASGAIIDTLYGRRRGQRLGTVLQSVTQSKPPR
jgi:hypothetical protein